MGSAEIVRTGRVWKFGDQINTDLILPNTAFRLPKQDQHKFTFHAIRPGWVDVVQPGDLIIGGDNFGMGSSRPVGAVLHACGIVGLVAERINGLCLRNLTNESIPAIDCPGVSALFEEGDIAQINFRAGIVKNLTQDRAIAGIALAPLLADIVLAGGVIPMLVREGFVEREPYSAADK
jgi:3-isopropylmalate/(R)-2-methylmalate dehydratase small subunit